MKSRLLLLAVLLVIICASCQPKKKTEPEKEAITGATYTNPLRERGAEPWAVFYKGKYYYTQGSESRIMLWETSDITNLNDSLRKPVWIPTDPSNSHHLWAPEMHRINNKWYIYFAADDGNMDNHQIYVIENEADIPTEGKFVMKGRIPTDKDNNWAMQTDIKRGEEKNYTFSEVCNAAGYERVDKYSTGTWDGKTYTLSYTNQYKVNDKVRIVVKKNWNDSNNSDGIRPDSVVVRIYQNGTDTKLKATLDASNNWTAEFNDLPKTDDLGEKYEYEVKEDSSSVVNGNAKTGYEVAYEVKKSTDKSTGITTISTDITNTHSPDSTTRSIQKKWSDNSDSDGIRPDSVKFNLVGNGKVADTVTLSEKNGWKATSKLVPKKENGKAITYTWQEVQEGVVTGESQIGYKATYTTDKDDPDTTIATNTHTPGRGKVTITKEIDPSNLNMDIGSAKFTFTLKGTDAYGKKHTYKEEVEFSKDEVAKQLKAHPGERIKLSATFDDLIYGTYTCSESGGEKYFKLLTLTSDSTNATVDQSKGTVTFKIGPEGTMGNAKLTADATFVNQMIRGSVKLVKKDSSGKRLKGVEFTIKDSDGNKIASDITNENGEIKFDGLLPDKYKITETKTQSGKILLKEPIDVTIPMTVTQSEVNDQNIDVSNAIKQGNNYYFYHLTYEVSNDSTLNLPSTGGFSNIKTYLPLIGGFVLILAAGFYYLKKKKGMKILKKKK